MYFYQFLLLQILPITLHPTACFPSLFLRLSHAQPKIKIRTNKQKINKTKIMKTKPLHTLPNPFCVGQLFLGWVLPRSVVDTHWRKLVFSFPAGVYCKQLPGWGGALCPASFPKQSNLRVFGVVSAMSALRLHYVMPLAPPSRSALLIPSQFFLVYFFLLKQIFQHRTYLQE